MKRARGDAGFTLAALVCVLTAAAILTGMMLPLWVMQAKRETEMELIFRGQEYVRAIQKYQRKYGIYPSSIDDLVSRDGIRFVRKQYKDPITGEDFRLINVNADGSLTGAVTVQVIPINTQPGVAGAMPTANGMPGGPTPGGGNNPAGNNPNNRPGVQNQTTTQNLGGIGGMGASMGFGGNSGVSGFGGNTFSGGTTSSNNNASRPGVGGVGTGAGTGMGTGAGTNAAGGVGTGAGTGGPLGVTAGTLNGTAGVFGGGGSTTPANSGNRPGVGGSAFLTTPAGAGAPTAGAPSAIAGTPFTQGGPAGVQISPGIAGVASESTKTAVMVYNQKDKYNEWEFIAPYVQAANNFGPNGPNGPNNNGNRNQQNNSGNGNQNTFQNRGPVTNSGNPIQPFSNGTSNPFSGGGTGGGANPFGGQPAPVGGAGGAGGAQGTRR